MRRCLPCNQHRNAPCRPAGCQAFTDNLQAQLDRAAVERRNRNLKIMRAVRNPK